MVDYRYRDQVTMLICCLLELNNVFEYEQFFFSFRLRVEKEIEQLGREKDRAPYEI